MCPKTGDIGNVTAAVLGVPNTSEQGTTLELVEKKWADWLRHRCHFGGPSFKARNKSRSFPEVGRLATSPLWYVASPTLESGGQNAGGPQVEGLATSPLPCGRPATLPSGGQHQKWPRSGHIGYITPAIWGVSNPPEGATKSEVPHKWADWRHHPHWFKAGTTLEVAHKWEEWLRHPYRMGGPLRFRAGDKIGSGLNVDRLAMSPDPFLGSPMIEPGGQNKNSPRSAQIG